ncbi:TetR/AcrR family transcriptional regulator [Nocardia takedensis]
MSTQRRASTADPRPVRAATPPAPAPRRRMSAGERRTQLLDIVRDIVAADGFAGVTIDRVAREADVARALVYQQFTDLSGLMAALLDRESAIAMADIGTVEFADDLDQVAHRILAYLHAAPTSWRIMLSPPDGGPPELRDRLEAGRSLARRVAAAHLARHTGVGVDPDGVTLRILLAATEELARDHLADSSTCSDADFVAYLRSLVLWAAGMESADRPRS